MQAAPELQGSGELLEVLTAAQRQTIELTEDIRLLSHDLHPGVLKHADLVDALRSPLRMSSPDNNQSMWSSRPTTI